MFAYVQLVEAHFSCVATALFLYTAENIDAAAAHIIFHKPHHKHSFHHRKGF